MSRGDSGSHTASSVQNNLVQQPSVHNDGTISTETNHGARNINMWQTSRYSYHEIVNVQLPDVPNAGTSWTPEEQLVLHQINTFFKSRVINKGIMGTINRAKLLSQYNYFAKFRKLEDPTRVLYKRTEEMLKYRIDFLKKTHGWA